MGMDGNTLGTDIDAAVNGLTADQQKSAAEVWKAIALVIVAHIQNHATVTVNITDAGLQRDNTGGNPATLAPAAPVTLAAGCIQ